MDRRHAILAVGGVAIGGTAIAADERGDIRVSTESGWRVLTGKEAEAYHAANAWLESRMKEAKSVCVGSTYADVVKVFKRDGGLSTVTSHRFVLILCPFVKVDVEFEQTEGLKARQPLAFTAKVVSVSKPYFEREFSD